MLLEFYISSFLWLMVQDGFYIQGSPQSFQSSDVILFMISYKHPFDECNFYHAEASKDRDSHGLAVSLQFVTPQTLGDFVIVEHIANCN